MDASHVGFPTAFKNVGHPPAARSQPPRRSRAGLEGVRARTKPRIIHRYPLPARADQPRHAYSYVTRTYRRRAHKHSLPTPDATLRPPTRERLMRPRPPGLSASKPTNPAPHPAAQQPHPTRPPPPSTRTLVYPSAPAHNSRDAAHSPPQLPARTSTPAQPPDSSPSRRTRAPSPSSSSRTRDYSQHRQNFRACGGQKTARHLITPPL